MSQGKRRKIIRSAVGSVVESLERRQLLSSASLVKDINQLEAGSSPTSITALNDVAYFSAGTTSNGVELWRSDGTAAGTYIVKDINPGSASSSPANLAVVSGKLFFSATTPEGGAELWVSDGTGAGTYLVKDIATGVTPSNPSNLTGMNGFVYFAAQDGVNGVELWKSDGTPGGTTLVKNINTGSSSSTPLNLFFDGSGLLYFSAATSSSGWELWASDGTTAGTAMVAELNPGTANSTPSGFRALGNKVYFSATNAATGTELYTTDGTLAGTALVADLNPGTASASPDTLTVYNGLLYMCATTAATGKEVWRYDPAVPGAQPSLLFDAYPGVHHGWPSGMVVSDNKLFFNVSTPSTGGEWHKYDGTQITLVKDVYPGNTWSTPSTAWSMVAGGRVYFLASAYAHDWEVWSTDGTNAGTRREADIRPGTLSSSPSKPVVVGDKLFFSATDGVRGRELYTLPIGGTVTQVDNLRGGTYASSPANLRWIDGRLWFTADQTFEEGASNAEPFISDGTDTGTNLLKEINYAGPSAPSDYVQLPDGRVIFVAGEYAGTGPNRELWVSDATNGGTQKLLEIYSGQTAAHPAQLTRIGNNVFFTANDGVNGYELWRTDGSVAGTTLVKDINPGAGNATITGMVALGGRAYFLAYSTQNSGTGWQIYQSDGTAAGTFAIYQNTATPLTSLAISGGLIYFVGSQSGGRELWSYDPATGVAHQAADIYAGSTNSDPASMVDLNGVLYFVATSPAAGRELWKYSPGTGLQLVKDVVPGISASSPESVVVLNGTLYFTAYTADAHRELWRSDGTSAGTYRVADIEPGNMGSNPSQLTVSRDKLYFTATTLSSGLELWQSDGTAAGTSLVEDIYPGTGSGNPQNLTNAGGKLFFSATDGTHGTELWVANTMAIAENVRAVNGGDGEFDVSWDQISDPAVRVRISWSTDGQSWSEPVVAAAGATAQLISGLPLGSVCHIRVQTFDPGNGDESQAQLVEVRTASAGGHVVAWGTNSDDSIGVTEVAPGITQLSINGFTRLYDRQYLASLRVLASDGNDVVNLSSVDLTGVAVKIEGGIGNDTLVGGVGNEELVGGDGDDSIEASDGNDTLLGGNGRDTLNGGEGDDALYGNAGNDWLLNDDLDDDTLVGGGGTDYAQASSGDTSTDSTGITLAINGASAVNEGSPYTLSLASSGSMTSTITGWTIRWGDGTTQQISGNPTAVNHVYNDGSAAQIISATAHGPGWSFDAPHLAVDRAFGPGSQRNVTIEESGKFVYASQVVPMSDGGSAVLGNAYDPQTGQPEYWLLRLGADGQPLQAFNNGQRLTLPTTAHWEYIAAIPTGGVVVVGGDASSGAARVARYSAAGTEDLSYGSSFSNTDLQYVTGAALDGNGRLVLTAHDTNWSCQLVRLTVAGDLDSSFGTGGLVPVVGPLDWSEWGPRSIVVDSQHRIYVAGARYDAGSGEPKSVIARFAADGSIDPTYGVDGVATLASYDFDYGGPSITLDRSDKVVAWLGEQPYTGLDAIFRLATDGSLDSEFGDLGLVRFSTNNAYCQITDIAIDGSGSLTVFHETYDAAAETTERLLKKFNNGGALETTFGVDGAYQLPVDQGWYSDLALDASGRLLLAGSRGNWPDATGTVVRLGHLAVANVAPTLSLAGGSQVGVGQPYSLTIIATDPGDDTITSYLIDWGDGSAAQIVTSIASPIEHTYDTPGTYAIHLAATDEDGTYYANTLAVSVTNTAQTLTLSGDSKAQLGQPYALSIHTNVGNATIASYLIDWGDGSDPDNDGNVGQQLNGSASGATHLFDATGVRLIVVTAVPSTGASLTVEHPLIVVDAVDIDDEAGFRATLTQTRAAMLTWNTLDADQTFEIERSLGSQGSWASISVPAAGLSHIDAGLPAGETIYYRFRAVSGGVAEPWSEVRSVQTGTDNTSPVATGTTFNARPGRSLAFAKGGALARLASDVDGDALTYELVEYTGTGVLALAPDGSLTYVSPRAMGSESFTYRVSDGVSQSAVATVGFNIQDSAPIPRALTYVGHRGQPIEIEDPARGLLGFAHDVDGDALSATLQSDGNNGNVVIASDGTFTYTPNDASVTGDTFTYQVSGAGQSSTTVTVTIQLTNNAPIVVPDAYLGFSKSALAVPAPRGLLSNDIDPDGDAITVTGYQQPAHGTVTVNGDGSFTFTPAQNSPAEFETSFDYTVSDGFTSRQARATIYVGNHAPVAWDDEYQLRSNTSLTVLSSEGVLSNDQDVDQGQILFVRSFTQPLHGSLVLNPDGSFVYTPSSGFAGSDSFTYMMADGAGVGSRASVVIDVDGTPLVASADAYDARGGRTLYVDAAAGLLANDEVASGRAVQLVSNVTQGSLNLQTDGSFTYTADSRFFGVVRFTYRLVDAAGVGGETIPVDITVSAGDPQSQTDLYVVAAGKATTVSAESGVLANDSPDGAPSVPLTAQLVRQAVHGTVSLSSNGSFTYTPSANFEGEDRFTYTSTEDGIVGDPCEVVLRVQNAAPVAVDDAFEGDEDEQISGNVLANDSDPDGQALVAKLLVGPSSGAVVLAPDGAFTYTPEADFSGDVEFAYEVSDGRVSSVARVRMHIGAINDGTVANVPTSRVDVARGGTLVGNLSDFFTDVESAQLLFATVSQSGPTLGALELRPDGTFTYTPDGSGVGDDAFSFTVTDGETSPQTHEFLIRIINTAPEVASRLYSLQQGQSLDVSPAAGLLAGRRFDAEGDAISASLVSGPADVTIDVRPDGSFTFTPTAGQTGTLQFTYAVSDGISTTTAVASVVVGSAPVVARTDTVYVHHRDSIVAGSRPSLLQNDRAFSGQSLSVISHGTSTLGTLVINSNGTYSFTPYPNAFGGDDVPYTISDGQNQSQGTLHLQITNENLYARGDIYTVHRGQQLSVTDKDGFLVNDHDPDRGDRGAWQVQITQNPSQGTVSHIGHGAFIYTPPASFAGTTSFTYSVSDGVSTSEATVTINVSDTLPAAANPTLRVPAGGSLEVSLAEINVDLDGDVFTFQTVGSLPQGMSLSSGGQLTYSPPAGVVGDQFFTYRLYSTERQQSGPETTVAVQVWNHLPEASEVAFEAHTGRDLSKDLKPYLSPSDDDQNDWVFQFAQNVLPDSNGARTLATAHGSVTLQSDGTFTYTSGTNYRGTDSFEFRVFDGHQLTAPIRVSIVVRNASPHPVGDYFRVTHGQSISGNVIAGTASGGQTGPGDLDGDAVGDSLSVVWTPVGDGHTFVGNSDGSFSFTPRANFAGRVEIGYHLTDGTSSSNPSTLTIDVTNAQHTAISDQVIVDLAQSSSAITLSPLGNDVNPDDDTLTILPLPTDYAPPFGTVTKSGNTFQFTPAPDKTGEVSFEYQVTDGVHVSKGTVIILVHGVDLAALDDHFLINAQGVLEDTSASVAANDRFDANDPSTRFEVVNQASHGNVTLNPLTGTFAYSRTGSWKSGDAFTYKLSNKFKSETVTVYLDTRAASPQARNDAFVVAAGSTNVSIPVQTLLQNDVPGNAAINPQSIQIIEQPRVGNLYWNAETSSFVYTPNAGSGVADLIRYRVADQNGVLSNSATISIEIQGSQGHSAAADAAEVGAGQSVVIDVLGNDLTAESQIPTNATITVTTPPAVGSAVVDGQRIRYTAPEGSFTGTTFTYQIEAPDGTLASAVVTVAARGSSATLVVTSDQQLSTDENTPVTVDVLPGGVASRAIITQAPSSGTATISTNGQLTYTPGANFSSASGGEQTIEFVLLDSNLNEYGGVVRVNVVAVNQAPTFDVPQPYLELSTSWTTLDLAPYIFDADGDSVSVVEVSGYTDIAGNDLIVQASDSSIQARFANNNLSTGPDYLSEIRFKLTDGHTVSREFVWSVGEPVTSQPIQANSGYVASYVYLEAGGITVSVGGPGAVNATVDESGNVTLSKVGSDRTWVYVDFGRTSAGKVTWSNADPASNDRLYIYSNNSFSGVTAPTSVAITSSGRITGEIDVANLTTVGGYGVLGPVIDATIDVPGAAAIVATEVNGRMDIYDLVSLSTVELNVDIRANQIGIVRVLEHLTQSIRSATSIDEVQVGKYSAYVEDLWEDGTVYTRVQRNIMDGVEITAANGNIGSIRVTGDIGQGGTGTPGVTIKTSAGSINTVEAVGAISAAVRAGGGSIGTVNGGGGVAGSVVATTNISNVEGAYVDATVHALNGVLGRVEAMRGDANVTVSAKTAIGDLRAAGNLALVASTDGWITTIAAGAALSGTVAAGGNLPSVTSGTSMALAVRGHDLGTLAAATQFSGSITLTGNAFSISAGRRLNASKIAVVGDLQSLKAGSSILTSNVLLASKLVQARSIYQVIAAAAAGYTVTLSTPIVAAQGINWIESTGDITSSITATHTIRRIKAGGNLKGDIRSNVSWIGPVSAGGNIDGSLTSPLQVGRHADETNYWIDEPYRGVSAGGSIRASISGAAGVEDVRAQRGDIDGQIVSTGGSIGNIEAGRHVNADVRSLANIGWVKAGGSINGDLVSDTGNIGDVSAGLNGGGDIAGSLTAEMGDIASIVTRGAEYVNPLLRPHQVERVATDQSANAISTLTTDLAAAPAYADLEASVGGALSGNVTAKRVGSFDVGGNLSSSITVENLSSLWILGDLTGQIQNVISPIDVTVWGESASHALVSAYGDIEVRVSETFNGVVESVNGAIDATGLSDISASLDAKLTVAASTADSFIGNLVGEDAQISAWKEINAGNASVKNLATIAGGEIVRLTGWEAAGFNVVSHGDFSGDLRAREGFVWAYAGGKIDDLGVTGHVGRGAYVFAKEGISNVKFAGAGSFVFSTPGVASDLEITGRDEVVTVPPNHDTTETVHLDEVLIEAGSIENVKVEGKVDAVSLNALKSIGGDETSISANDVVRVSAGENVDAGTYQSLAVPANGTSAEVPGGAVSVSAVGDVSGVTVIGDTGAEVSTWGSFSGHIESNRGAVSVETQGTTSFDEDVHAGQVRIVSWGGISGGPSIVSQGSVSLSDYSSSEVSATIAAQGDVYVESHGAVSSAITTTEQGGVEVNAVGEVTSRINSVGDIYVRSQAGVSGSAGTGEHALDAGASLSVVAANRVTAKLKAVADISVLADEISIGEVRAQNGEIELQAFTRLENTTVYAKKGGQFATQIIDTLTINAEANENTTVAAAQTLKDVVINANSGDVSVVSGGGQNNIVIEGTAPTLRPKSIAVSSPATITGSYRATESVSIATIASLDLSHVSTTASRSNVSLFGKEGVKATVTSSDSIAVSSTKLVEGTYTGGAYQAPVNETPEPATASFSAESFNASITTQGAIGVVVQKNVSGTITSTGGAVDVITGGNLSATVTGASANVSAAGTTEGGSITGPVTTTAGNAVLIASGTVSGAVNAHQDAVVEAGNAVSGAVSTLEGNISVTAKNGVSGAIVAKNNAEVMTKSLTSNVIATDGRATVHATSDITTNVTAGTLASVVTAGKVSAAAEIEGASVNVVAKGDIAGTLRTINGDLTATSGAVVSGVFVANGSAAMTMLGNFTGTVTTALDADISTYGSSSGPVSAGRDLRLQSVGAVTGNLAAARDATVDTLSSFSGSLQAGTRNASVSTLGEIEGTVTAYQNATLSVGGSAPISTTVQAGGSIEAATLGDFTGELTATLGDVVVSASGNSTGSITAGRDAVLDTLGAINGTVIDAGRNVSVSTLEAMTGVTITAGADASVVGQSTITGLEIDNDAGNIAVTSVGTMDADLAATAGDVVVSSFDTLTTLDVVAGGDVDIVTRSNIGSANLSATGRVSAAAFGDVGIVSIIATGAAGVSLTALNTMAATANSSGGDVNVVAGSGTLNTTSADNVSVLALGDLSGSVTARADVQAVAGGDLAGTWSAGHDADLLSMQNLSAQVDAVAEALLFANESVTSAVINAGTLTLVSYGSITTPDVEATDHIARIWARGNVDGVFVTPGSLDQLKAYGSVGLDEDLTTTFDLGSIELWETWGQVDASITADGLVRWMYVGEDLVQSLSAGSTGVVTDFDRNVFGDWPADFKLLWHIAYDPEPWSLDRVLAELQTARRSLDLALTDTTAAREATVRASSAAAYEAAYVAASAVDQMLNEQMPKANALIDVNVRWIELALNEAGDSLATSTAEVAQLLVASLREGATASASAGAAMSDALADLSNALAAAKTQMVVENEFAGHAITQVKTARVAQGLALAQQLAAQNSDEGRTAAWERKAKSAIEDVEAAARQIENDKNKILNAVQEMLSLIGFVPGIGVVADLLNAGISVLRGNYADAAISLISAVPFAGDAAGAALKGGQKLFRALKSGERAVAAGKELCFAGRLALKFGRPGAWVQRTLNLSCFVAGTQVVVGLNDDGSFITKNIEDLRDGDTLLAKSDQDESDDVELKRVESAFGKTTYHLRYLTIRDAEGEEHAIQTTDEHPFWVEGMGWTNAGDLQVGQTLSELDGTNDVTLVATQREEKPEGVAVFNLTVEGDHTYFVADENGNAVWVHNKLCGRGLDWFWEGGVKNAFERAAKGLRNKPGKVPGLLYENTVTKGRNFIKFDRLRDAKTFVDRKLNFVSFEKGQLALKRASKALTDNPDFRLVIEVPNEVVRQRGLRLLARLDIANIVIEVAR